MTKRKIQYWVIPPEADAEFIASMEEVLDTYEEPYDQDYPVLCMDEQPVQLHKEIRKPIPATKNHARRVDYEYERCGTATRAHDQAASRNSLENSPDRLSPKTTVENSMIISARRKFGIASPR